jgi:hypothetical protein
MINLRYVLALSFLGWLGCQEPVQTQEPVLDLKDGVIVRKVEMNQSYISDYHYLSNGSSELVRGRRILRRKVTPDYNPITGSLDPFIDYKKLINIVNHNNLIDKYEIVNLICTISADKKRFSRPVVLSSKGDAKDLIRESDQPMYTHNESFIIDPNSLSFSKCGPYCWLSADGLYQVNVKRSGAKVTDIRTAHIGFFGIEENVAVMSPSLTD